MRATWNARHGDVDAHAEIDRLRRVIDRDRGAYANRLQAILEEVRIRQSMALRASSLGWSIERHRREREAALDAIGRITSRAVVDHHAYDLQDDPVEVS